MDELREIKEILSQVMEKLNKIESRIGSLEEDKKLIETYKSLLSVYASILGKIANLERIARIVSSDIDRAIVRVLSDGEPRNISEITEEVKRMRGKSSRRIVAERLNALCNIGILERVSGKGKVYRLKPGLLEEEALKGYHEPED
ncbi:MAG: VWA domain-containing protein [Candidatus Korarchaeum sp.]|nr:VWA domain-containing protein [Candidatus Korarchaeum sp.]